MSGGGCLSIIDIAHLWSEHNTAFTPSVFDLPSIIIYNTMGDPLDTHLVHVHKDTTANHSEPDTPCMQDTVVEKFNWPDQIYP